VFRVLVLYLQPISAMYALGSWLGPSDETQLNANNMQRIYTEYGTKAITEPTETTGIYSFVFFLYELETFGATRDETLLMAFYLKPD